MGKISEIEIKIKMSIEWAIAVALKDESIEDIQAFVIDKADCFMTPQQVGIWHDLPMASKAQLTQEVIRSVAH